MGLGSGLANPDPNPDPSPNQVGDGKTYPAYGDTVRVHYTGKLQECGTV